jgi:hypothetical protein
MRSDSCGFLAHPGIEEAITAVIANTIAFFIFLPFQKYCPLPRTYFVRA